MSTNASSTVGFTILLCIDCNLPEVDMRSLATTGRRELLHHPETAKAGLYSLGGADSVRFVDDCQYPIMNRAPLLWHFEIKLLREHLLNVQFMPESSEDC